MKSISPFYAISKFIYWPAVFLFYKVIRSRNFKNLPDKGAVLICGNHVNAFMDAISVQMMAKRQLFSLARGDVFKNPVLRGLLTALKIIPIYRISEGADNLKKNESSFALSYEVFAKGNPLIIYPEAICVQERRIRKLKKGAARIALGFDQQQHFQSELILLPLGLNYSDPKKIRSRLFINFGEAIPVSAYSQRYKKDKAKAINELTNDLEKAIKALVVHVEHKENDRLVEDLFEIYKPEVLHRKGYHPDNLEEDFRVSTFIADAVNQLQSREPQRLEGIKSSLSAYTGKLRVLKASDQSLIKDNNFAERLKGFSYMVLGMPLFILGLIMNYPPYKMAAMAADKIVKNAEFYASMYIAIGWTLWLMYYMAQLLAVALVFHNWIYLWIYALSVPMSGYFGLEFYPFMQKLRERTNVHKWRRRDQNGYENLINQRKDLFGELESAFPVLS